MGRRFKPRKVGETRDVVVDGFDNVELRIANPNGTKLDEFYSLISSRDGDDFINLLRSALPILSTGFVVDGEFVAHQLFEGALEDNYTGAYAELLPASFKALNEAFSPSGEDVKN